jgi:putative membrane protein
MNPAAENSSFFYLILCGMIAIISMILPGLSGSFVLILLGNYQLVMIESVNTLNFTVLFPVGIGVVIALPLFSRALSWIYKTYKNETLAVLAGFIFGSLRTIWPWKTAQYLKDSKGVEILNNKNELIIHDYIRFIPDSFNKEVLFAFLLAVAGVLTVWLIEHFALEETSQKNDEISDN